MATDKREFFAEWSLPKCRDCVQEEPAPHQAKALSQLSAWFEKRGRNGGAGILVLPTGAGKTFTAVRFLAEGPLSEGYKVLWLAHTHHLLEQAFHCFRANRIGAIREPRRDLRVRVVSGTPGHFPPRDIETMDDVVIGTLQTITTAVNEGLDAMVAFLAAAGKKLFIVFDEAHHAPAPSYRKLLKRLKASSASILGLTATPVYSDATKQGWLKDLFPDGILAQARATELMAAGVLARPHAVPRKTRFEPTFESRDYEKWVGSSKDIPEYLIDELANNAERNAFIALEYAANREKYGKTIISTDRWFQCEAIAEALGKHDIKAGCVYSHVDASLPTVAQRKKRDRDENARVLERFRNNDLKVLINVRMLTEGTDIPDAQTVFLTRQTTSRILLTQMVGRAMRGPKFKGTKDAYIVSFEDDWRDQIQWAGFDLADGGVNEGGRVGPKRPPLQLISIDLVKRLARQMDGGVNVAVEPFLSLLPLGWYNTLFDARIPGSDDVEEMDLLAMVYEDEQASFTALITHLLAQVPEALVDESATLADHQELVSGWRDAFFGEVGRSASDLDVEILQIARHIAQRGTAPAFFAFEVRADHDLESIAQDHIDRSFGARPAHQALLAEFAREDRFWRTLFSRYEQFRHFYDGCVQRILNEPTASPPPGPTRTAKPVSSEPDQAVKNEVRARDGQLCLACGSRRGLEVDHITAVSVGGSSEAGNLQTLCGICNRLKSKRKMSFRVARTALPRALHTLPEPRLPVSADAANVEAWDRYLRRTINFFYQCAAVGQVAIGGKGDGYYNWTVTLRSENPSAWIAPHMKGLLTRIQEVRETGGKARLSSLSLVSPGEDDIIVKDD